MVHTYTAPANRTVQDYNFELLLAAKSGNINKVRELLQRREVYVNHQNDTDQDTALHWASRGSYGEIVSLLYAAGADVNIQNKDKETPLHWACWYGRLNIVNLLIMSGVDVNIKDKDLETPLYKATYKNHMEVVQTLLTAGAEVNIKNKF
eukprot:gene31087-38418_t